MPITYDSFLQWLRDNRQVYESFVGEIFEEPFDEKEFFCVTWRKIAKMNNIVPSEARYQVKVLYRTIEGIRLEREYLEKAKTNNHESLESVFHSEFGGLEFLEGMGFSVGLWNNRRR